MVLSYKGSLRALRGSGMAYGQPQGQFDDQHMHVFLSLGIQDMSIRLDEFREDGIAFTIRFFLRETNYFLRLGETVTVKEEGNAFGCELLFTVE